MEVENIMTSTKLPKTMEEEEEEDERVPLPGFRFHPTDEELVGFYLRRKVEKKWIGMELIKQADIYKYDPWDLPSERDKEWYFFCKRGRKYKNSVRPNRVTGSGFWKATGIDRPIYSGRECIGLKKSLVYYRGSAGKGIKTEWMMQEFRLPAIAQEAEVWTLCRILKRSTPYRKYVPELRVGVKKINYKNNQLLVDACSETCSMESSNQNGKSSYISFSAPIVEQNIERPKNLYSTAANIQNEFYLSSESEAPPAASSFANHNISDINELLRHADWEDLQSLLNCPAAANAMYF